MDGFVDGMFVGKNDGDEDVDGIEDGIVVGSIDGFDVGGDEGDDVGGDESDDVGVAEGDDVSAADEESVGGVDPITVGPIDGIEVDVDVGRDVGKIVVVPFFISTVGELDGTGMLDGKLDGEVEFCCKPLSWVFCNLCFVTTFLDPLISS